MKLSEITGFNWRSHTSRLEQIECTSIAFDSRQVQPGSLFVAIRGNSTDGHDYLNQAIEKGAAAVVVDQGFTHFDRLPVPVARVNNTRAALSQISSRFYDSSAAGLTLFGITGTNGKTTSAYILKELLRCYGKEFGLLGTIEYDLLKNKIPAQRTTPDRLTLEKYFSEIKSNMGNGVILEVSSHALDQLRVHGLDFDCALFTNCTQDHLDYHGNMNEYFQAKRKLFSEVLAESRKKRKLSVVNIDDPFGRELFESISGNKISFGFSKEADYSAKVLNSDLDGTSFIMKTPFGNVLIQLPLFGEHNVLNFIGAAACMNLIAGQLDYLKELRPITVPGRLEPIQVKKKTRFFVDYAHTEDALRKVLQTLKPKVVGRLILVFGCGGDRDKTKRSKMGRAAADFADYIILTNDNPRTENPEQIISGIQNGFGSDPVAFEVILNREQAIKHSVEEAKEKDVVLVAGKGHETEQLLGEQTLFFSDKEIIKKYAAI